MGEGGAEGTGSEARLPELRQRGSSRLRRLLGGLSKAAEASPQMHDRVTAPRSPALGDFLRFFGSDPAQGVTDGDVFLGECIGPAQRTHGDVVSRPRTDPR